jgi:Fur family transcriptional regulator, ferric uptake regulator
MRQYDCKEKLNKADLRATPARLAILQLLEKEKNPIDVNMAIDFVNKRGIKTDPATVFRILNVLTEKGFTIPVQFQEDKMRYELANRKHHHHLVCENCGKIEDVSGHFISGLEKEIQTKKRFLIKRHSLEFFGLCLDCQK